MTPVDPFDLERFVAAQNPLFDAIVRELADGRKRTHWMWFVFPQARGLGHSPMAVYFGIGSLDEARAYLAHPVLGPRLAACTRAVLRIDKRSLHDIFGSPDDRKFCSSMALFDEASGAPANDFRTALERYCADAPIDERRRQ